MIRPLTQADAPAYQTLRLLSLKEDPDSYVSLHNWEAAQPASFFANKILYATKKPIFGFYGYFSDQNELLAYAQLGYEYYPKKQHLVNFYELCVHPENRRKGLATKMIQYLVNLAKAEPTLEQIILHVNANNNSATALYQKLGFTHTATLLKTIKESPTSYQDEYCFLLPLK